MQFDSQLVFFGSAPYASVSDYQTLVGVTNSTGSKVINLGNARDLGIGDGEAVPKVALYLGAAITSSCSSLRLNFQFQGSTDSTNWTTYVESGAIATTTLVANAKVLPIDVPHRAPGAALPLYYRINIAQTGNASGESISTGSIFGGIVIQRSDNPISQYPSNFVVV